MKITKKQFVKVATEWSAWAGEPVTIEASTTEEAIYAFGSELAVLRLKNKLGTGEVYYSKNLKTWYYSSK